MSDQKPLIGHLRVVEPCVHGRLEPHGQLITLRCPGGSSRPTNIDELEEILEREGFTVGEV